MINHGILDDFGVPILENTIKPKAARVVRYRDGSFLVRRLEPFGGWNSGHQHMGIS